MELGGRGGVATSWTRRLSSTMTAWFLGDFSILKAAVGLVIWDSRAAAAGCDWDDGRDSETEAPVRRGFSLGMMLDGGRACVLSRALRMNGFSIRPVDHTHMPTPISPSWRVVSV